jgi:hypothetical protein
MEVENKMNRGNGFSRQPGKEKTGSVSQKMAERSGEFDENNVGSRRTPICVCSERKPKTKNQRSLSQPLLYFIAATVDNKSCMLIFVNIVIKI